MRVLKFIVNGKTLEQDPTCDFDGLFPGREETVKAVFNFSPEWRSAIKVAAFLSVMGTEYTPQVLDADDSCIIPREAILKPSFKIKILGRVNKLDVETNALTIYQRGGPR